MRFLVFSDQSSAQSAVDTIDSNARRIFQARGYEIDASGDIIGKRLSDGVSQSSAAVTSTWDVPRKRLDGAWIVCHPENQPGSGTVIDQNGSTALDAVMAGVSYVAIEDYNDAWFPLSAFP